MRAFYITCADKDVYGDDYSAEDIMTLLMEDHSLADLMVREVEP